MRLVPTLPVPGDLRSGGHNAHLGDDPTVLVKDTAP
jgi:hypothetical protein